MISCSQDFLNAMKSPIKQVYIKLEFYDNNMNYIEEFSKQISKDDLGSLSVDLTRPVRRSFSFSFTNLDGRFNFGEDNLVWLNKRMKLYMGLKLPNGNIEYVPLGFFVLTEPSDTHNFEGKKATITGQDKAFLMTDKRGKFLYQTTIEAGTKVVDAIRIIAQDAGETLFNFDVGIDAVVPYELTYEPNDNRWKAIQDLALFAKCDVFYDVYGYLRLKKIDLNAFENEPICWSYKYGDENEMFYAGNIRQLDDTNLANHIYVCGGSSQTATCFYELKVDENDPLWANSPYSIQKIGDILYYHNNGNPDPLLTTNDECKWRAKWELMHRLGYTEKVSMHIAPNFLHDAGDIIEIIDDENNVSGKYLLQSFNLPLNIGLMSCECIKYRKVITDWNFI